MRFYTSGFFVEMLLLVPVDMLQNDLDFVRIFLELFNNSGALPVSTTLVKFASPVSLTPVKNYSPVSMTPVSDAFTVFESVTGVNDTTEEFLISVNDISEGNLVSVNNSGKAVLYQCQQHRRNTAYVFGSAEIFVRN
jgi:hypothetical protein